jgi:multiple sugar transport system substrate-binding protein
MGNHTRQAVRRGLSLTAAAGLATAALVTAPVQAQDASPAASSATPRGTYAGLDKDLSGVTIKMATIGGQPYEAMYASLPIFEEATGAKVEIVFLGDGFQIDRYLKTNYASGTVDFDVAWNHTSFMAQYVDFVEPLQSYFTADELAAFSPSIIAAATIDGNLQLIPRHADISALHYRTDLFGDDLPVPTTLQELYDDSVKLVGEGKVKYGTQFAGKEEALSGRFYEVLFANGGDYFDADMQPIFDSEAGVASATWMRDLYANKLIPADTPNLLWPEVAQNFCDGNVAAYLEWYGWYSMFQDPNSCPAVAGKFGLARGPVGSAGVHTGWAGAHAFSVAKASQNKEAAVQLVKFLTSQEIQYEEAKLGVLPVRADVAALIQEDAAASPVQLDRDRLALAEVQVSEDFRTPPLFADWISFTDSWSPTLQAIILGDQSVEDGLAKGVSDARDMLDSLGY